MYYWCLEEYKAAVSVSSWDKTANRTNFVLLAMEQGQTRIIVEMWPGRSQNGVCADPVFTKQLLCSGCNNQEL
jgi:hypothetical protein